MGFLELLNFGHGNAHGACDINKKHHLAGIIKYHRVGVVHCYGMSHLLGHVVHNGDPIAYVERVLRIVLPRIGGDGTTLILENTPMQ
eukprot:9599195-Ditylum_brightwellii.AAC.1